MKSVREALALLRNPEKGFSDLNDLDLEHVVFSYLRLLVMIAVVAAAVNMIISALLVIYFSTFMGVTVSFPRYLNFVLGQSSAIAIIYIISGTVLMFFLSTIVSVFVRIRYPELLKKLLYSMFPVLLFGWVPQLALFLLVWCGFLFFVAIRCHREKIIKRTSIEHRD